MSVVFTVTRPAPRLRSDIEIRVAEQVVPVPRDTCPDCRRTEPPARARYAAQLALTPRKESEAAAKEVAEATLAEAKAPGKVARGGQTCPTRTRLPQLPLALPHAACAQHQTESFVIFVTELETGRHFEPVVVDFEAVCGYAIALGVEGATAGALVEDESEAEIRERRVWAVGRFVASRVSITQDGSAVSVGDLPLVLGATPPSPAPRHLAPGKSLRRQGSGLAGSKAHIVRLAKPDE